MPTMKGLSGEDLAAYEIEVRTHATRRMFRRNIFNEDVERVLVHGEIIEQFDDTPPFHHALVNGRTRLGLPLHVAVIVMVSDTRLSVITT